MDDIVARPRYSRRSVPSRKRRRSVRETGTYVEKVMRQVVIALIILVVIGIVISVKTPVTNFLGDKIKHFMSQDIQIKEVYTKASGFLGKLLSDKTDNTADKTTSEIDNGLTMSESSETFDSNGGSEAESGPETGASTDVQNTYSDQIQDEDTMKTVDEIKAKYSILTPVEGTVSSAFGERIHPVWKTEVFHSGVDIKAEKGVPIKAALAGKVIEASNSVTYGKYIKIEHEDGIITLYGHCSQLLVKKGQTVDKGKNIAKVGNTGVSVGTHLHFEIWKDGKPLDPLYFIKVPN